MIHTASRVLWLYIALAGGMVWASSDSGTAAATGTWRGRSICATQPPSCHNEDVVYYIKEVPGRTDVVSIQADKIVDGKAITMGTGPWQYHPARHILEFRMPEQVWLLKITGSRMEGTLTLADQTIFRRMTLSKGK